MMENLFNTAVLLATLASVTASLTLFGTLLSGKLDTATKLFDKSKVKFTDGDNT